MKNKLNGWINANSKDLDTLIRFVDSFSFSFFYLFCKSRLDTNFNSDSFFYAIFIFIFCLLCLPLNGIYKSFRLKSIFQIFRKVITGSLKIFFSIYFLNIFLDNKIFVYERNFIIWFFNSFTILFLNHVLIRFSLRKIRTYGRNKKTMIFWGPANLAFKLKEELDNNPWMGIELKAWFTVPQEAKKFKKVKSSGTKKDMEIWLQDNNIDQIIFSDIPESEIQTPDLLKIFGNTSNKIYYIPYWIEGSLIAETSNIGKLTCFKLWGSYQSPIDKSIKRIFDLSISIISLSILSPLFLVISIFIKIDSNGPIFFKQKRYGLDSKSFYIYKFRSMNNKDKENIIQAKLNDQRVTKVGKFLRKFSLDELPQLFNVIIGDMSLVGPRPHAVEHNEEYRKQILGYMQRHMLKPGITGLAQVEGCRGETPRLEDMQRRVYYDIKYQKEQSFILDIKIILKTIMTLFSNTGY